jgi:tRNA threonylcarbamoyladenosine biosynthesis protein TsaB
MINALAIDTATTALGLCLQTDPQRRSAAATPHLRTHILQIGLKHSEKLMPAIRTLLEEAELPVQELDLIICSTGPGSFTGIRIGLATAKGLADALPRPPDDRAADGSTKGCRLIGVSTLDGLAHRFRRFAGLVAAVNPSLRKKYYAALYQEGGLEGDYLETTLQDLCETLRGKHPLLITGAAAVELYELLLAGGEEAGPNLVVDASGQSCDPAGLLACGVAMQGEPGSEPLPLYLRKSEAEITFFGE